MNYVIFVVNQVYEVLKENWLIGVLYGFPLLVCRLWRKASKSALTPCKVIQCTKSQYYSAFIVLITHHSDYFYANSITLHLGHILSSRYRNALFILDKYHCKKRRYIAGVSCTHAREYIMRGPRQYVKPVNTCTATRTHAHIE